MRRCVILAAVVVLAAACSSGNAGTTSVTTSSTTTSTTTTSTTTLPAATTTTTVASLPEGTWHKVPHDEAVFGGPGRQGINEVVAGGPGLVAVGVDETPDGDDADAAVWTSPDGITWTRVTHDEAVFGGDHYQTMLAACSWEGGLVAVGADGPYDDHDAAVWLSVDGITWVRLPHDENIFGGDDHQEMSAVAPWGEGLIAVGWDGSLYDEAAAVWTTPDGISWSRVPHDEAVFGGYGNQLMNSVAAGESGLVAVGQDYIVAAVWTSSDGIAWSRIPFPAVDTADASQSVMFSVEHTPAGFVAVGGVADLVTSAAAWTSLDGSTWVDTSEGLSVPTDAVSGILDVVARDHELTAVGVSGSADDWDAAVWISTNGTSWSPVPHDEAVFGGAMNQRMSSVAAAGHTLVAAGDDSSDGDMDAAVWYWTPD
jgi:hypothetical protein